MNGPWCYRKSKGGYDKTRCDIPSAQWDYTQPERDSKCPRESSRPRTNRYGGRVGDRKEIPCADDCPIMTKWDTKPPSATVSFKFLISEINPVPDILTDLYNFFQLHQYNLSQVSQTNKSLLITSLTRADNGEWLCSCGGR